MDDKKTGEREASSVEFPNGVIEIEWLYDDHDCDTCGNSYATGAVVRINNAVVKEFIPRATCYGSDSWSEAEIYVNVLNLLGYEEKEIHTDMNPHAPEYIWIEEEDDEDDED